MRKFQICWYAILLCTLMVAIALPIHLVSAANDTSEELSSQETQLSDDDWKVVIDEKKSSDEFSFIQRNLESSNLADNGQFLLVAGIILLVLSAAGIIFFSRCMYKLLKVYTVKRKPKHGASRYK